MQEAMTGNPRQKPAACQEFKSMVNGQHPRRKCNAFQCGFHFATRPDQFGEVSHLRRYNHIAAMTSGLYRPFRDRERPPAYAGGYNPVRQDGDLAISAQLTISVLQATSVSSCKFVTLVQAYHLLRGTPGWRELQLAASAFADEFDPAESELSQSFRKRISGVCPLPDGRGSPWATPGTAMRKHNEITGTAY